MIRKWIKDLSSKSNAFALREIATTEEWKRILDGSNRQPVLLFKHSRRCSLSDVALTRVLNMKSEIEGHALMYIVNVVNRKSLSQIIANDLGIGHESPQVLLLHRGNVQAHASHNAIDAHWVRSALQALNA